MLTKYQNQIFQTIVAAGLNVRDFSFEKKLLNDGNVTRYYLTLKDSFLHFIIEESPKSYHNFNYWYKENRKLSRELGAFPALPNRATFNVVKDDLNKWLKEHALPHKIDSKEPNLWEQLNDLGNDFQIEHINFEDNESFSVEEKKQVILSLNEAKLRIQETVVLSEPQFKMLNDRFDYLEKAIDRIENKTDWKSLTMGSIISLLLNMYVGQDTGAVIWNIIINALSFIPSLPSPPIINPQ